jgi:hypothetical protein
MADIIDVRANGPEADKIKLKIDMNEYPFAHVDGSPPCRPTAEEYHVEEIKLRPIDASGALAPMPDQDIQNELKAMTPAESKDLLEHLSGIVPVDSSAGMTRIKSRSTFGDGLKNSAEYLEKWYHDHNIEVKRIPYKVDGRTFFNLEATIPGTSPGKEVIIGAHLDSTAGEVWSNEPSAPGADDDGSGTVAAMMTARALSHLKLPQTVRIIHFTGEEQGLLGSTAYVNQLLSQNRQVTAMLQMDMIGYLPKTNKPEVHFHDVANQDAVHKLIDASARNILSYGLNIEGKNIPNSPMKKRSDHWPFLNKGIASLLISEQLTPDIANPNYHTTRDSLAPLSLSQITEIAKLTTATAAELARGN